MKTEAKIIDMELTMFQGKIGELLARIQEDTGITYEDSKVTFDINVTFGDGTGPQKFAKTYSIKGPLPPAED